jgi:hypothetical protein
MTGIRISRGTNALEAQAIEAWISKLGIQIDPNTREIDEASLARSSLAGGAEELRDALSARGKREIDLDLLSQLPIKPGRMQDRLKELVQSAMGTSPEAVRQAEVQNFVLALEGATAALAGFNSYYNDLFRTGRGKADVDIVAFSKRFSGVLRRFNHAADRLLSVQKSGPGAVTPEELRQIREAYRDLLVATREHATRLQPIFKENFRDAMKELIDLNDRVEQTTGRSLRVPGQAYMMDVYDQAGLLSTALGAVLEFDALFRPQPPPTGSIADAFARLSNGETPGSVPDLEQWAHAVALNTIQRFFTNRYGTDTELKQLVAARQEENPHTLRSRALEDDVLGGRDVQSAQIDALQVARALAPAGDPLRDAIERKLAEMR